MADENAPNPARTARIAALGFGALGYAFLAWVVLAGAPPTGTTCDGVVYRDPVTGRWAGIGFRADLSPPRCPHR